MIRVFIIEDEAPALERLSALLANTTPPCNVVGTADSQAVVARWLRANPAPDLIFADIQLGDGVSLDLFQATPPPCPVIFTTAHDDYLFEAFAANSIAYLLKPIKLTELDAAIAKYQRLGRQLNGNLAELATTFAKPGHRQRILAQRGTSFQPVAIGDIAYFFSENKLTFLVTRGGEKCLVNEPLTTLAGELDPAHFFRANRNYLVHASAVKSFSSVGKGRLAVSLQPRPAEEVQVSQENAADFRAWAGR